jgi:hypothetical protein
MFRTLILFISILVTSVSLADTTKGHIRPLPEELLEQPVTLSCGVTIIENAERFNGKIVHREISDQDREVLNKVCNNVVSHYNSFAVAHHMGEPQAIGSFHWNVSLLPVARNYRCLNDTKFRFYARAIKEGNIPIDGYTDSDLWLNDHYGLSFSTSDRHSRSITAPENFKTVFAHEIFHAMSWFFSMSNNTEKTAEDFTAQLGYGR